MQFVAEDPVHVVVRNEQPPLIDAGSRGVIRPLQRRLFAKFTRGLAPDWAREIGLASFGFKKRPEGVAAEQWLAYYDSLEAQQTQGWNDEERQAIEAKLQTIDGVLLVEKPRLAPPWPAYDKIATSKDGLSNNDVVAKIVAKVEEDGYAPAEIAAYELENRNRKSVLAALEKLAARPLAAATVDEEEEELVEA